jgi:hypothetical protein
MITFPKKIKQNVSGNITITFAHEGDGKYSFRSENERLQAWIATQQAQRVSFNDIHYMVETARNYIKTSVRGSGRIRPERSAENPVQVLNERCQQIWRRNMSTIVVGLEGEDHCPTVYVEITLPDGRTFEGKADNQRQARVVAAKKALESIDEI